MLYLLFKLGSDRYAINTDQIVEVLPLVMWKAIPSAPAGIAGAFSYHGTPVPLIDLNELATRQPSRRRMTTRIMLVNYVREMDDRSSQTHLLGLLAEDATALLRRTEQEFSHPGVVVENAPYLGPVTMDGQGIIQRVEVNRLLPTDVQQLLFSGPLE